MKCQKTINFRTKNWVEIYNDLGGRYNNNNQIEFKASMLKSSLCDYSDAYVLVKRRITVVEAGATPTARQADRNDKQVIFINGAQFTDCRNELNGTQVACAKDLDLVMPNV